MIFISILFVSFLLFVSLPSYALSANDILKKLPSPEVKYNVKSIYTQPETIKSPINWKPIASNSTIIKSTNNIESKKEPPLTLNLGEITSKKTNNNSIKKNEININPKIEKENNIYPITATDTINEKLISNTSQKITFPSINATQTNNLIQNNTSNKKEDSETINVNSFEKEQNINKTNQSSLTSNKDETQKDIQNNTIAISQTSTNPTTTESIVIKDKNEKIEEKKVEAATDATDEDEEKKEEEKKVEATTDATDEDEEKKEEEKKVEATTDATDENEENEEVEENEEEKDKEEEKEIDYTLLLNNSLKKKKLNYSELKSFAENIISKNSKDPLACYALALYYYSIKKPNYSKAYQYISFAIKPKRPPTGATILRWKIIIARFKLLHILFITFMIIVGLIASKKRQKQKNLEKTSTEETSKDNAVDKDVSTEQN